MVFDGYTEEATTKSEEQRRRGKNKCSPNIIFNENTNINIAQEEFLSNNKNKARLISVLDAYLKDAGVTVIHAVDDADELIVSTALKLNISNKNVMVVVTDTDVLAMLIGRAPQNNSISVLHPATSRTAGKVYAITEVQTAIEDMKEVILFAHAVSGCDKTSAL